MFFSVQLIFMIFSIILMCIIFFTLFKFRKEPAVIYLLGLVICRIFYASSVILEKSSHLLQDKLIFRNIQQTSLLFIVPLFLLFVLELTGRNRVIKIQWKITLFSVFILFSLCTWFDSYLHIVFYTVELIDGQLITTRTIYSNIFNILCYSSIAVSIYLLFRYVWTIHIDLRKPGILVLLFASIPFVLEIIRFANPQWSTWIGTLSTLCGMTGTLMLLVILRYKFFSIIPVAKNVVFDTFQEGMLITNASQRVVDGNKKAIQFFSELGYSNFYGRHVSELLEQWPKWCSLTHSLQQGSVEIDTWLNSERKIYRVNVYPLSTLPNQRQGSVSLIVDITEQQGHLEKIAQLNKLKDQLFTIVSHDIRSPLAMQFQLIELLEEDLDSFDAEHLQIIVKLGEQIRHTLGMSNNLLEWFRSQREDVVLRPQLLELSDAVEECCQLLGISSEAKNLNISNSIPTGTYVYADREVVLLVVRNLLANAIKFTPVGGSIQINAQLSGKMIIVSVRDNGIGMAIEQVEQLFVASQIHSSVGTLGEGGAGLGLLVSKEFIQLSGESIWVESVLGQGSVFYFTLRGGAEI
ncbi:ATP-binding protein [Psychrobacillus sp.]|uniref:sensor histidine kinase n=1 Tax=Psychrobacillus sp. TaxID=1871623 RepID=UPI0028BE1C6C|nr:ATP-binding protein [Psychrobacillus sp.]